MAEGVRFELTERLRVRRFSKPVPDLKQTQPPYGLTAAVSGQEAN